MKSDNKSPSLINFSKHLDGKLATLSFEVANLKDSFI